MNESTAICRPYTGRQFRGRIRVPQQAFPDPLDFHGIYFQINRIFELLHILYLVQYSYNCLVTEPYLRVIYLIFC